LSLVTTALFVVYILLAYFARVFRNSIPSDILDLMTIIISVFYLLSILWPVIWQYKYIYFSDDGKLIILRWYSIGLVSGESKSIEIPKEAFAGFEITKKYLGLFQYITLYQNFQNRRAGYPPVIINALSRQQYEKIAHALSLYK